MSMDCHIGVPASEFGPFLVCRIDDSAMLDADERNLQGNHLVGIAQLAHLHLLKRCQKKQYPFTTLYRIVYLLRNCFPSIHLYGLQKAAM
jgi:hypothetical protein